MFYLFCLKLILLLFFKLLFILEVKLFYCDNIYDICRIEFILVLDNMLILEYDNIYYDEISFIIPICYLHYNNIQQIYYYLSFLNNSLLFYIKLLVLVLFYCILLLFIILLVLVLV
jgi:hypothetical protein